MIFAYKRPNFMSTYHVRLVQSQEILNCESTFIKEKALVGALALSGHCEISRRVPLTALLARLTCGGGRRDPRLARHRDRGSAALYPRGGGGRASGLRNLGRAVKCRGAYGRLHFSDSFLYWEIDFCTYSTEPACYLHVCK